MIMLKITEKQSFTLSLKHAFLENHSGSHKVLNPFQVELSEQS